MESGINVPLFFVELYEHPHRYEAYVEKAMGLMLVMPRQPIVPLDVRYVIDLVCINDDYLLDNIDLNGGVLTSTALFKDHVYFSKWVNGLPQNDRKLAVGHIERLLDHNLPDCPDNILEKMSVLKDDIGMIIWLNHRYGLNENYNLSVNPLPFEEVESFFRKCLNWFKRHF